nr:hypothetical protein [Tanacetum cinerariifolium]
MLGVEDGRSREGNRKNSDYDHKRMNYLNDITDKFHLAYQFHTARTYTIDKVGAGVSGESSGSGVRVVEWSRGRGKVGYSLEYLHYWPMWFIKDLQDKMADENDPAPAPTRSDDQILPFAAWMPIGKSNFLGYTEIIHFVLRMAVNNLYQPWRAILFMINQCLTGNTSGHDKPGYPTFLTDKANLGSPTKKGRKDKRHVIPYCQFTKLIICHLGRIHNIHQRSTSLFHLAEEDLRLGNLKFAPEGKVNEVFGMHIPNELISNNIRNAPYYNSFLEMVAKHDRKVAAKKEGKKKTTSAKTPKPKPSIKKSSKPAPAPKSKATKERPSKASTTKPPKPKPAKEKSTKTTPPLKASKAHVGGVAIREPVAKATRPFPVVEGKGKAIATEEQVTHSLMALHTPKRRSTTYQFVLQRRASVTKEVSTRPSTQAQDDTSINIVRDSPSPADAETETATASEKTNSRGDTKILQFDEEQGKDVDDQVNLEENTNELDQGQDGSDPCRIPESRPLPEQVVMDEDQAGSNPGKSHGALVGPDPEPTHDEFMSNLYPKVQESLKYLADEHVILKEPLSLFGTLSSMKNLDDAYTIGD